MIEQTPPIILYADVVGYTHMLRNDREEALEALRDFRNISTKHSEAHRGELLQSHRDYVFLSFQKAGDALLCAEAMQSAFGQLPRLDVRIGIHAGEVIQDDDKFFGEGVHLVTQIEKTAIANSIVVTDSIVEALKNDPEITFEKLGRFSFKNIEEPVSLYARKKPGLSRPKPQETSVNHQAATSTENYRRAVQLLMGYLVAAWTALQFVDWLLNRYNISPYWTDIMLWTFIGIIPSLLLLFINRDRILRRNFKRSEKIFVPINLALLFGSLTVVYGQADLGSTMRTVTFQDADGSEIRQTVLKNAFKVDLPIFPFTPEQGPDSSRWIGYAIQLLVKNDLISDKYLHPYLSGFTLEKQYGVIDKIKNTKNSNSQFYLDGTFGMTEDGFEIKPMLRNKKNGTIIEQKTFAGEDIFALVDSISVYLRPHLGISEAQINESVDLNVREVVVNNFSALEHLTKAILIYPDNHPNWYHEKALALDSTSAFTALSYVNSLITYSVGVDKTQSVQERAMKYRYKLPQSLQMAVLINDHLVNAEYEKAEKLLRLRLELEPEKEEYLNQLGYIYYITGNYEKLIPLKEKIYAANPSFNNRLNIIWSLWRSGKAKKVEAEAQTMLKSNPENTSLLKLLFEAQLQQEKFQEAGETLEKWILLQPESEEFLAKWWDVLTYMQENSDNEELLNSFPGSYRSDRSEMVIVLTRLNNAIFTKAVNQYGFYLYPVSDSALFASSPAKAWSFQVLKNNPDFVESIEYFPGEVSGTFYLYNQDASIQKAEAQLRNFEYDQALVSYEAAIVKHPKHYYLHEAKKHIEYLQSKTTAEINRLYETYAGSYEKDLKFWVEDGQLYFENTQGRRMIFIPTSDTTFIDLSTYFCKVIFDPENQTVKGYDVNFYDHTHSTWTDTAAYYIARISPED